MRTLLLLNISLHVASHAIFTFSPGSAFLGTDKGQSVAINTDAAKPPISNCPDNFLRLF